MIMNVKKIFNWFFNCFRVKDIIIFKIEKKKFVIKSDNISYENLEIRDIKIRLVRYYINKLNLNKSFKNHLFNYLYQVDPRTYKMACLIKYISDKRQKFDEISAPFFTKKDLTIFREFNLKIKKIKQLKIKFKPNLNLILIISLLRAKKIEYQKLKECFFNEKSKFNPKIKYKAMLRAKMKHFENIYLNKLDNSLDNTIIYIDPSLTSFTFRQKEYLEDLKKNKKNFFFYIPKINYYKSFKTGLRICFSFFPKELKTVLFNILIQRKEIDDIINNIKRDFPFIQEFYTGNNIYLGATYLNENLKELGIKTINFSHGIGLSCPLVNYDIFYVFSKMQRSYYFGTSKFKYYNSKSFPKNIKIFSTKQFALFFIHQNVFTCVQSEMTSSYKEVIIFIEQVARDYEFPVYAKYHPGSTEKDKILSEKIKIINNIDELPPKYNYLAVTLHSTYVLELLDSMPFLIINPQKKITMNYLFPDNNEIYIQNYLELKEKIGKFMNNQDYYLEYWKKLYYLIK